MIHHGQLYITLAHILKTKSIAQTAIRDLQAQHFSDPRVGGSLTHALLFDIITSSWKQYQAPPDLAVLHVEIARGLNNYFASDPVQKAQMIMEVSEFLALLPKVTENSQNLASATLSIIHDTCVIKPEMAQIVNDAMALNDLTGIGDKLSDLERRSASVMGGLVLDNVLTREIADEGGERVNTGVTFIDSMLGGGAGPVTGCGVGLIAPQSSGKTTLGVQLATQQALMGRYTLLALVEEGLSAPIRRNLLAAATGISTEILEACKDNVEAAIAKANADRDAIMAKISMVDKYLNIVDIMSTNTGRRGIEDAINTMCQTGRKPAYTYIDYADALAFMDLGIRGESSDQLYGECAAIGAWVVRLATQTNSLVCLSQQMSAENVKKGTFHVHDEYSAKSNKLMYAPFKYVFTLSPVDPKTKNQVFRVAKARNDAKHQTRIVNIEGPMARIADVSDKFSLNGSGKKFVDKRNNASSTQFPQEK